MDQKETQAALKLYYTLKRIQAAYNTPIKCRLYIDRRGVSILGSESVKEFSEDYDDSGASPAFQFKEKTVVKLESRNRLNDYYG